MTLERRAYIQKYLSGDFVIPPIEIRRIAVELEEELYHIENRIAQMRKALEWYASSASGRYAQEILNDLPERK